MADKSIYNIPADTSNILFYYLKAQNASNLAKLKKQFEDELKRYPDNTDTQQIISTINRIMDEKK